MRATRFPWQSVLIAGLMTGSILLASGLPAYSQAEIRGAQNGKLPDAIRLVFRGKPGDTYKYKKSGQSQQIQHAENAVGKQDTNGKETTEALKTLILQGPGPDQTLLLEVHSAGKKTVSMANGKTSLETEPPADALFTLTPTFQYVKAVPLEPAPAPKPAGKPGKAPE